MCASWFSSHLLFLELWQILWHTESESWSQTSDKTNLCNTHENLKLKAPECYETCNMTLNKIIAFFFFFCWWHTKGGGTSHVKSSYWDNKGCFYWMQPSILRIQRNMWCTWIWSGSHQGVSCFVHRMRSSLFRLVFLPNVVQFWFCEVKSRANGDPGDNFRNI